MCVLEDVFHKPCGHWAERPRIRQSCSGAPDKLPGERYRRRCNRSYGIIPNTSVTDHVNKCPKCKIDLDKIASTQTGMWLSCGIDKVTGKPYFRERNPESEASKKARERAKEKAQDSRHSSWHAAKKVEIPVKSQPAPRVHTPVKPWPESRPVTPLSPTSEFWWQKSREESSRTYSLSSSWSSHGHAEL